MKPTTTATAASLHLSFAAAFYFFSLLVMHQTCKQALDWVEGGFEIRVCLQPKPSTYFPSFWHTSRLTSAKLDWARLPIRAVSGPVGTSRNYDGDGNAGKRLNTIGAFSYISAPSLLSQKREQQGENLCLNSDPLIGITAKRFERMWRQFPCDAFFGNAVVGS